MFNAFMDFVNGAVTLFTADILLLIAIGTVVLCLVIGLLFAFLSKARREKNYIIRYNKQIAKDKLNTREDLNRLNAFITKKQTATAAEWVQYYPNCTCMLLKSDKVFAQPAARARRGVVLTVALISAVYLTLALFALFAEAFVAYLIIPALVLIFVIIMEGCFSWCEAVTRSRLTREHAQFRCSLTKAFAEIEGVCTCFCPHGGCLAAAGSKAQTKPVSSFAKSTVTDEPRKRESKPVKHETAQIKDEKVSKMIVPERQIKEETGAKRQSKELTAERKTVRLQEKKVRAPKIKSEKPAVAENKIAAVKVTETEKETVVHSVSSADKSVAAKSAPEPKFIPAPQKEVQIKRTAEKQPAEPRVEPGPAVKENKPMNAVKVKEAKKIKEEKAGGAVEDRMAALSARLGSLRQTFTETTETETVNTQIFESRQTIQSDSDGNTTGTLNQTLSVAKTQKTTTDGVVTDFSGKAYTATRASELNNGQERGTITVSTAELPSSKQELNAPKQGLNAQKQELWQEPKEVRQELSAPTRVDARFATSRTAAPAPKQPQPNFASAVKSPSPAAPKAVRYDEDEVKNALSGLMSAMNKQQSMNETQEA